MDAKNLLEMKQERATLTKSIRDLMTEHEGKEMDAVKKEELSKLENKFDSLSDKIGKEEKQLERERVIGEKANPEPQNPVNNKVIQAFRNVLAIGDAESKQFYAALQQSNPSQAGYLVAPEQFVMELIKEIADASFMRQKCRVLPPLKNAQSLGYPTRTAAMSSFAWGTEIQAPIPDSALTIGKREFKPVPGTSQILVSKTLLRNVPNADALVRAEIAEEYSKNLEMAYMTGNGAGQPLGLFTASADGIPTSRDVSAGNTATEIKFDGLVEAKYLVKQQYRLAAEWVMHRLAIKQLAKLKDSAGQYIWQPSVIAGTPDRLLGDPINESEYAPSTFTSGLYVGVYGNLKNYWIADSLNAEIQVLMELYALTNQACYISRLETDGAPVVANAFSRIKLG